MTINSFSFQNITKRIKLLICFSNNSFFFFFLLREGEFLNFVIFEL